MLQGKDRYYLEDLIHVSALSVVSFQVRFCQEKEDFLFVLAVSEPSMKVSVFLP